MRKISTILLTAALFSLNGYAAGPAIEGGMTIRNSELGQTRVIGDNNKKETIPTRAGETVNVTIEINMESKSYSLDLYFPPLAVSMLSDGSISYTQTEDFRSNPKGTKLTGSMELPKGKYDFIGSFKHNNSDFSGGYDHLAWIILEDVEVDEGTTVTFIPDEATNKLEYRTINPDGEESELRTFKYIDEDYHVELVDPGNIIGVSMVNTLMHSEFGQIDYLSHSPSRIIPSEDVPYYTAGFEIMDQYMNNVSDKYEFRQLRIMRTDDEDIYVVNMNHYGSPAGEKVMSNTAEEYFDLGLGFAPSYIDDLKDEEYDKKYILYYGGTGAYGSLPQVTEGLVTHGAPFKSILATPSTSKDDEPRGAIRYERTVVNRESGHEITDMAPWLFLVDNNKSGFGYYATGNYGLGYDGKRLRSYATVYPGHPGFCYTLDEIPSGVFSTPPFILMDYTEEYSPASSNDQMKFSYSLRSQAGETRGSDRASSTVSIKYNGEEIYDGTDLGWTWPKNWALQQAAPGDYLFTVEDRGFNIDGLTVASLAQISINDSREDHFAPVVQAMQIRDKEGRFTQKFDTYNDVELRIVTGDFNVKKSAPYSDGYYDAWLVYSDTDMKVEYALYHSGNFKEWTNFTKQDEDYYGFGQYWKGTFSDSDDVTDGWYDLRITVTDASGNYQTQTLSPAFLVGSAAKVDSLKDHDSALLSIVNNILTVSGMQNPSVSVYSETGQLVYQQVGDIHNLETLARGLYIIKAADKDGMKVIKFIKS